jgi:hypothetical protein
VAEPLTGAACAGRDQPAAATARTAMSIVSLLNIDRTSFFSIFPD